MSTLKSLLQFFVISLPTLMDLKTGSVCFFTHFLPRLNCSFVSLHRSHTLRFWSFLLLQVFVFNQWKSNYFCKIIMLNTVKTRQSSWLGEQSLFNESNDYGESLENLREMLKCYLRQYKCMHTHNTNIEFHTYKNHAVWKDRDQTYKFNVSFLTVLNCCPRKAWKWWVKKHGLSVTALRYI